MDRVDLLKTPDAAHYAGTTAQHLRRLASKGRAPHPVSRTGRGHGGGNFYDPRDLDAWNEARGHKRVSDTNA